MKRWDVPHCIRLFRAMTREAFGDRGPASKSTLRRFRHYFRGLVTDSCYDVAKVEAALQGSFGVGKSMFDSPDHGESRLKVAVTATTISDSVTFLFSNYNGGTTRKAGCGMLIWTRRRVSADQSSRLQASPTFRER